MGWSIRSPVQKKHRMSEQERRSVITGKKLKLKVKKTSADREREQNRQQLLHFLNAQY